MKISAETVEHIAHLARLNFEGSQKDAILNDLNNIVGFMDKLSEVNTEGVEPLIFMTEGFDHLREDEAIQSISQKEALQNAPKKDSDYFRIPKVLDK
jgi:aspartyl-tRNA(Asn)/glutamyl-tRNA(Gln) amidotransferase subunit C